MSISKPLEKEAVVSNKRVKRIDLDEPIGKVFNGFKAIKLVGFTDSRKPIYKCQCESCGKIEKIDLFLLRNGRTCYTCRSLRRREEYLLSIIKMGILGNLTPKEIDYSNDPIALKCECKCGKPVVLFKHEDTRLRMDRRYTCTECSPKIRNFKDHTGTKVGLLTVTGLFKDASNTKERLWECLCECGNTTLSETQRIADGKIYSCGCQHKIFKRGNRAKEPGLASFNSLYGNYARKSHSKNRDFDLTREKFKELTSCDCYYCGRPPIRKRQAKHDSGFYLFNGIDKVIPTIGYIEGNCVPCCFPCNYAKSNMSQEEFYAHIKRMYDFSVKQGRIIPSE